MAKNSVRDFDATAANNTDIQSVNIAEGCAPSGINNAIRELMADMKDVSAGTIALESPQANSITISDATEPSLRFLDTNAANSDFTIYSPDGENHLRIKQQSTDRVTIKSSGEVGIGLTDPDTPLEVQIGSSGNALKLSSSADGASVFLAFEHQESGTKHVRGRIRAASNGVEGGLIFETGASSSTSERMRIDNSGNLIHGATSASFNDTAKNVLRASSDNWTIKSAICHSFNRSGSDGEILEFYRTSSSKMGSIGAGNSRLYIASDNGSSGSGIMFGANGPLPVNRSGTLVDNTKDLGSSSYRWDDIFATNGTIQTSDQNEKQDIASLTDAEITAAKAISKLFKTFKWKDKVASKGDSARTHAGVIAQEVQSAMDDAGLDATKYAFWCSNTWWETQTEVPAVEAVEARDAVLDDDGNIVTEAVEAVEAQDAYTRTDIYNTADEAPEGATERTRLGIRYPELLAFVGAATEQRLTSIEARLTALEG